MNKPIESCKPFTADCRDCMNQVPCWAKARATLEGAEAERGKLLTCLDQNKQLTEELRTSKAFVADLIAETRSLREQLKAGK